MCLNGKTEVECVCAQKEADNDLKTWKNSNDKCTKVEFDKVPNGNKNKKFTWSRKFDAHDLENYDICFRLNSYRDAQGEPEFTAILKKTDSERIVLFEKTKILINGEDDNDVLIDFCLKHFVANDPEIFKNFNEVILTLESANDMNFKADRMIIYGKDIEADDPVFKPTTELKIASILPANMLRVNGKSLSFVKKPEKSFEVRIYGKWLKTYSFTPEQLEKNILDTKDEDEWKQHFEICRPRTISTKADPEDDCRKYGPNFKIPRILAALKSEQIQIVLVLSSTADPGNIRNRKVDIGTIHMWDTCELLDPCKNGGLCQIIDAQKVECDCRVGFAGEFCDLRYGDSCTTDNKVRFNFYVYLYLIIFSIYNRNSVQVWNLNVLQKKIKSLNAHV